MVLKCDWLLMSLALLACELASAATLVDKASEAGCVNKPVPFAGIYRCVTESGASAYFSFPAGNAAAPMAKPDGNTETMPTADQSRRTKSLPTRETLEIPIAMKSVGSVVVYDKAGKPLGQGSGFFVDKTGKFATNFHVIKNAASVVVKSSNGAFYPVAGILAVDKQNDLAVLRVEGRNFAPLRLGNSDAVKIGDKVFAIGTPLGLEATVSDGLISGLREVQSSTVFQTTAAISPGSSGGALLNSLGQVIGITAFQLTSGQSLNFAIPANYLKPLLTLNSTIPFDPPTEPANEAKSTQDVRASNPIQQPVQTVSYWTHLGNGSTVEVKVDGNYLYEKGEMGGVTYICDLKRDGERWVGKCTYRGWRGKNLCFLQLEEVVISLTNGRIEGESQVESADPSGSKCPSPGTTRERFALTPRF